MTESPDPPAGRAQRLDALRAAVSAVSAAPAAAGVLPFGVDAVDCRLEGGGLARAVLHEFAGDGSMAGEVAAGLFAAGIAARMGAGDVLWALGRRDLFAPGIEQAGLPPSRVFYAEARGDADLLAVMEDALRLGGVVAVIGEVRRLSVAATRRLQLAAGDGGTAALLVRQGRDPFADPSAAVTRWRLWPAPSAPLAVAGVGRARWNVELVRQRGGAGHHWTLEACDETGRLALPADPVHGQDRRADAHILAA